MRRILAWVASAGALCGVVSVFAQGCGSDDGSQFGDAGNDATADVIGSDVGFADACSPGSACGDGGVCAGNVCCDPKLACGGECCGGGQVCSFQKCVTPGGPCIDSTDCKPNEVCDYSLGSNDGGVAEAGCQGGVIPKNGKCLAKPPVCAGDGGTDGGGACIEKCEVKGSGAFQPELKFAWGGQITAPFASDVMMAPIVIELDDDNCDGKVNENDIPEIVFTSFTGGAYTTNGTLHAISIKNGAFVDKWSKAGEVSPSTQLAAGDVDGVPGNEVIACMTTGQVRAYKGNGTVLWTTATPIGCYMPNIADLDGDGKPEVVVEGAILNGATGATKASYTPAGPTGGLSVSDLDGDGLLDVVTASQAFHGDGTRFVDTGVPGNFNAVGDFDKDGKPEVVATYYNTHSASFWSYDANAPLKFKWMRQNVDINGSLSQNLCPLGSAGNTKGGGPPTVADFDGDGVPDIALAGGIGYAILNGAKVANSAITNANTLLWSVQTKDCSSAATGSSVFDFDGDGKAEVVYSDENYLRIYDGLTGAEKFKVCNTTGTLIEYPLVADIDNDGHADIVVVSNAYASGSPGYQCNDGKAIAQSGVRVFGDTKGAWVRTRRIWNEHAYHVTNVNEDGTIPKSELRNWTQPGLNNFRQNKQPGSEFSAPDAIGRVYPACGGEYGLYATITNAGEAALPAGVVVGFYAGVPKTGTKMGQVSTSVALYPAQSETLFLALPNPPAGVKEGKTPVYIVIDDTVTPHPSWTECRPNNNVATGNGGCLGPN